MRRIVVPLDGSTEAASVLPDVRTLMGPDGELVLVRDPGSVLKDRPARTRAEREVTGATDEYLQSVAAALRDEGVTVRVSENPDTLADFDSTVSDRGVDMVAWATHESDPSRKLAWESTLRRALVESPVPILLRRPERFRVVSETSRPRLLVPLDGSKSAETALPMAEELAREWDTSLWLTQVISLQSTAEEETKSLTYLQTIAQALDCDARVHIVAGRSTATMLIRTAQDWMITDVVMSSHGHTASPRFVIGSVAEKLIQHLQCRIVVVPASVAVSARQAGIAGREVLV